MKFVSWFLNEFYLVYIYFILEFYNLAFDE